jgi:hypothetical protein
MGIPRLVEAAITRFAGGPSDAPDLAALVALDAEVRRWAAANPAGAA